MKERGLLSPRTALFGLDKKAWSVLGSPLQSTPPEPWQSHIHWPMELETMPVAT